MCLFLWRKRTETRTKDAHWSLSIGKVASDLKISNAWHKGGCVGVHVHSVHCVIKPFGGNWDLSSPPKSPHWGDFGGGLWIKNTIGGLSRYLKTGKKFEMKISTKKSQIPTPSLTFFIFAPSPKRALLVCLFLQRKERKRRTLHAHRSRLLCNVASVL